MIGGLKGKIEILEPGKIILWTRDIGYLLYHPINLTLKEDEERKFYVYTYVKEDALNLYAFITKGQLRLFQTLIQVSGIGPKLALAVLETSSVDKIKQAIQEGDVSFFTRVPGIGKKGGQKIILELSSVLKLDIKEEKKYNPQLLQALKNLGYKFGEVKPILEELELDYNLPLDHSLRLVLRQLAKKTK